MADQKFHPNYDEFFLDLHGVLRRDAARAIKKRIRECRQYSIRNLTVVYGTPGSYDGSVAAEVVQSALSEADVSREMLPAGLLENPQRFTERIPKVTIRLTANPDIRKRDAQMGFVPFKASREQDRWRRRLCENYYYPLREWIDVAEAARWVGDHCSPDDVLQTASDVGESNVRRTERSAELNAGAMKKIALEWWHRSSRPQTVSEKIQAEGGGTSPETSGQVDSDEQELAATCYSELAPLKQAGIVTGAISDGNEQTSARGLIAAAHGCSCLARHEDAIEYLELALLCPDLDQTTDRLEIEYEIINGLILLRHVAQAADRLAAVRAALLVPGSRDAIHLISAYRFEAALRQELDNTEVAEQLLVKARGLTVTTTDDFIKADTDFQLATVFKQTGRAHQALDLFRRAVLFFEDRLGASCPVVMQCHRSIASLQRRLGQRNESQNTLEEMTRRCQDAHPLDLAHTWNELGIAQRILGHHESAISCYRQAMEAVGRSDTADPFLCANINQNLAVVYRHLTRFEEAVAYAEAALQQWSTLCNKDDPRIANSMNNLAILYSDMRLVKEADALFLRALEIGVTMLRSDHPDVAYIHNCYGVHLTEQGDFNGAEHHLASAVKIRSTTYGDNHPDTVRSLVNLSSLYFNSQQLTKAESVVHRAVEAIGAGPDPDSVLSVLNSQLKAIRAQLRRGDALSGASTDTSVLNPVALPPNDRGLGWVQFTVGGSIPPVLMLALDAVSLASHGQLPEACAKFQAAIELEPNDVELWADLGHFQLKDGKVTEALSSAKRAIDLNSCHGGARETAGAAYAALGKFREAQKELKKAINLARSRRGIWDGGEIVPDKRYIEGMRSRLGRYARGRE